MAGLEIGHLKKLDALRRQEQLEDLFEERDLPKCRQCKRVHTRYNFQLCQQCEDFNRKEYYATY